MEQKHIQHLFWRAGFGESISVIQSSKQHSSKQLFRQILKDSEHFSSIDIVNFQEIVSEFRQIVEQKEMRNEGNKDFKRKDLKDLKKDQKEEIGTLNSTWLDLMANEKGALREKMAFFWHGHLVARSLNPYHAQSYINTLRKHALGNFGELLMAVSQEAAMLQFLNNKQNKKRSPNENFARELMELFTLGRGNYTEKDIKEVARAFTGWDFKPLNGEFVFNERQHDEREKEIFGKKGDFKGEDVINMILEKKQTARFITTKIYQFFVNEKIDNQRVEKLATIFYKNNYEIKPLLEAIFTADWFYENQNIGNHIKSPIELLVGMRRSTGMSFEENKGSIFIQRILGQVLFYPPNVAGWKGGTNWIDSSSLLFRMQLPAMMFLNRETSIAAKSDGDINTDYQTKRKAIKATTDWEEFSTDFSSKNENDLTKEIADYFLQVPINQAIKDGLAFRIKDESKSAAIKRLAVSLMMLPEYQVC